MMMNNNFFGNSYYANDLDAFIPEFWANESLVVLEENLVAAGLCYRDFENTLARMGDTVNCQRPNRFEPVRKTNTDTVTVQDATSESIPVKLDQHLHISFMIKDGEESKSNRSLIDEYIVPAMKGNARFLDRMVVGQYGQFYQNSSGQLSGLTGTTAKSYLIAARKKAEDLLWPNDDMRPLIHNTYAEAAMLNTDLFVSAEKVGDNGSALRNASLGKKFGFDNLQTQQMAFINTGNTKASGAVNNAAGYPAGTTTLTIDGFSAALGNGSFIVIDGYVSRVVSSVGAGTPTSVTIVEGLPAAVLDNAIIDVYTAGTVNLSGGYAAGWSKPIVTGTFTVSPQVGQMVTFGTTANSSTPVYTVIGKDVSTTSITLDRPLVNAIANADKVNLGPAGSYSFSFLKDAIALVVRPLAMPMGGAGARAAVSNYNGLSMRACISYDGNAQGHLVTLDFLCGITVLSESMGLVMLG